MNEAGGPPCASRDQPLALPEVVRRMRNKEHLSCATTLKSDTVKEQLMDSHAEMHARPCPIRIARTPASSTPQLYNEYG